jgi:4-amino-4-deoxy-L-arabinose transferase-like glycosyltransferase
VNRWRDRLAWLGPLAVGFLVRLPGLESRPIWYDEAFSLLLARRPVPEVIAGTAADTMPPLYYLVLGAWQSLGQAIWQQRMLNVLLGTILVGVIFLLGLRLYGRAAAGWGALLGAVAPLLVFHAQELRMYTLLALSLALYLYFFLIATEPSVSGMRWGAWAGVVAAGAAALYSHNLALFSLVSLNLYAALRRDWRNLGRLVLAQVVMLLLFLPWLGFVPGQIQKIQDAFWTLPPGALELIQSVVAFHAWLPLDSWQLVVGLTASVLALVLTLYLTVRRLPLTWREGLLGCVALVPPVLLFVASYVMRPVFVPRAYVLSLVAYLLLAGRVVALTKPRRVGWILAGAFAAAAVIGLVAQSNYRSFPRSPFAEAASVLTATTEQDDLVLHSNKLSFFPMHVYAPGLPQAFLPDEPGSSNDTLAPATQAALGLFPSASVESLTGKAARVRFVIFQRELDEYAAAGAGLPPALDWLLQHGAQTGRLAFNDLWVYQFELRK